MLISGCIRTSASFPLSCNIILVRVYQKTFKKFSGVKVEAIIFVCSYTMDNSELK